MRFTPPVIAWILAALVFGLFGCGATLSVQAPVPATVNLGAARKLVVIQSEGRRSAREFVIQEAIAQCRSSGHFQAVDRTEDGIELKVSGRTARPQGKGVKQQDDEIFVRIDVVEWGATRDTTTTNGVDKQGNANTQTVTTLTGRVLLAVTAATSDGKAILAEKEYKGGGVGKDEDAVIQGAARQAVATFLSEVTPSFVEEKIPLDESDGRLESFIAVARKGNIALAIEEMKAYLKTQPDNPVALYNQGAFLDATNRFKEAIDHYTRAIQRSNKPMYVETKAACGRRLAAQEALASR